MFTILSLHPTRIVITVWLWSCKHKGWHVSFGRNQPGRKVKVCHHVPTYQARWWHNKHPSYWLPRRRSNDPLSIAWTFATIPGCTAPCISFTCWRVPWATTWRWRILRINPRSIACTFATVLGCAAPCTSLTILTIPWATKVRWRKTDRINPRSVAWTFATVLGCATPCISLTILKIPWAAVIREAQLEIHIVQSSGAYVENTIDGAGWNACKLSSSRVTLDIVCSRTCPRCFESPRNERFVIVVTWPSSFTIAQRYCPITSWSSTRTIRGTLWVDEKVLNLEVTTFKWWGSVGWRS